MRLTSSIIKTSAGAERSKGLNICLYDITARLRFILFPQARAASLCHTAKMDGKCLKEGQPLSYESPLSYTPRVEGTRRAVSPGIARRGGTLKSGRRNGGPHKKKKMQVKSVRHETHTQHSQRADTSTKPERKEKCTCIVPATVPLLWKCSSRRVNCRFCVTSAAAYLSFLTHT